MARAIDIAKYFLLLAESGEEDAGEAMTHLKLQKLLYYAQGFHLAIFQGEPLFDEPIEAWKHGPVVNAMWGRYSCHGSARIPQNPDFDPDAVFTDEQKELLNDVWNAYGQFSAWKLRDMTHQEPPWVGSYQPGSNEEISNDRLQRYFETQIEP